MSRATDIPFLRRAKDALLWLAWQYPFFAIPAAKCKLVEDPAAQTAYVTVDGVIHLCPAFCEKLDNRQLAGILAHELSHPMFGHHGRRAGRQPTIWNLACFPAGTLLPNGKRIETVATMKRHYDGVLYRIKTQIGTVEATGEHPFYVRRRRWKVGNHPIKLRKPEWVEAQDLRVGDYVCVPRLGTHALPQRSDTEIDLTPYIRQGVDGKGRKTFGNRAVKKIPLTPDVAWLIGLYVAEGSGKHVQFSLGAHETDLIERVQRIMTDLGYRSTVDHRLKNNTRSVRCGTPVFGRWLHEHCGRGAKNKHIPSVILQHSNSAIRRAFLHGLTQGDGYDFVKSGLVPKGWHSISTTSHALACDVVLLLAQEGLSASIQQQHKGPRWIGKTWTNSHLHLYAVIYSLEGAAVTKRFMNGHEVTTNHSRAKFDEHGTWLTIKKIDEIPFNGLVYNLTTEDHTYVANGLLVHNCDSAINHGLQSAGIVLPDGGILPRPEWINADGTVWCAERIYDTMLKDAQQQQGDDDAGDGDGQGQSGPGGTTKRRPKPGQGCGVEDPEGKGTVADGATPRSLAEIERDWREVAIQAAAMQKQAGRGKGAALAGIVTVPPPKVNWPSILRHGQSLAQAAQGRDVTTWQKRGRRSGQLGPQFPGWVGTRAAMAIVVDVSGSMSNQKTVAQCVSEVIAGVRESGVPAYLVTHDDGVQWAGWIRPGETAAVKAACKGYGGTDAHEAYDRVRQLGKRIDVFIHLTDCYLSWPAPPENCRKKIVARIDSGKDTPVPEWAHVIDVELGR